jgi:hypothetical protein
MKKKIGELYNKPIVIGNKNEVTKNEVHVDELSNVQSGGGGVEIDPLTEYYLSEPQDVVWDASTEEGCKQAFETLWPLIERCGFDFFDNGGELSLKPWFKSLSIIGGLEEADCNTIVNYKYRREGDYDFIVFNPYGEFALKKFYNGDGSVKSYSCGFFE